MKNLDLVVVGCFMFTACGEITYFNENAETGGEEFEYLGPTCEVGGLIEEVFPEFSIYSFASSLAAVNDPPWPDPKGIPDMNPDLPDNSGIICNFLLFEDDRVPFYTGPLIPNWNPLSITYNGCGEPCCGADIAGPNPPSKRYDILVSLQQSFPGEGSSGHYNVVSWEEVIYCEGDNCALDPAFVDLLFLEPDRMARDSQWIELQADDFSGDLVWKITESGPRSLLGALGFLPEDILLGVGEYHDLVDLDFFRALEDIRQRYDEEQTISVWFERDGIAQSIRFHKWN